MMVIGIKAKIVSVNPAAGYDDIIYEQYVVIELPDGKTLGLFDPVIIKASKEMINQYKIITIFFSSGNIEKVNKTIPRVELSNIHPLDPSGNTFYGIINNIDVEDIWHKPFKYKNVISINIGYGDILVHVKAEIYKYLKVGDYVKLNNARADSVAFNDI